MKILRTDCSLFKSGIKTSPVIITYMMKHAILKSQMSLFNGLLARILVRKFSDKYINTWLLFEK